MRSTRVQESRSMPVAQQAEIGPNRCQVIKSRRRHCVVKTTSTDTAAEWMRLVRRQIDGIVRHRPERHGRRALGARESAMGMTQHARNYAIADRRLIVSSPLTTARQKLSQVPQSGGFMLVPPECL